MQIDQVSLLAVAQVGFILLILSAITILLVVAIRTSRGSTSTAPQGGSWLEFGSFFVVALGIAAVIIGFLSILLFLNTFEDGTQALGFLTALFGAITGLVGTYFGVKTSSDAREGAQRLAAGRAGDTTPPEVTLTDPADRAINVDPGINPSATFSKDMDSVTINAATFKLLDQTEIKQIVGSVVYEVPTRMATFTPADKPLDKGKTYAATITAGVRDQAGNTLAQDYTWHFTVVS